MIGADSNSKLFIYFSLKNKTKKHNNQYFNMQWLCPIVWDDILNCKATCIHMGAVLY